MYNLKPINEKLKDDVKAGKITIEEAARELHKAGWMNYIDVEKAKRLLELD
jgi:hypothetical protein